MRLGLPACVSRQPVSGLCTGTAVLSTHTFALTYSLPPFPLLLPTQARVTADAGPSPDTAPSAAPSSAGLIGLSKDKRELNKESKEDAFLGALDYLTKLSSLRSEAAGAALQDAIDKVDRGSASARSAITSLGQGMQSKASELRAGSGSLGDKVRAGRWPGGAGRG